MPLARVRMITARYPTITHGRTGLCYALCMRDWSQLFAVLCVAPPIGQVVCGRRLRLSRVVGQATPAGRTRAATLAMSHCLVTLCLAGAARVGRSPGARTQLVGLERRFAGYCQGYGCIRCLGHKLAQPAAWGRELSHPVI
jgi:hypothetical protein